MPHSADRLVEALQKHHQEFEEARIIVNIQGDEPCIPQEVIKSVVEQLQNDPQAVMSTAVTKLTSAEDALSRSIVKVRKRYQ